MIKLRLGTRKSKLALAQSRQVAKEFVQRNPRYEVELIGITTEGDRITDRPLQDVPGKDFFVKELDQALLRGDIDFSVHSLKDLSLTRPVGITLAAIPKRASPHDVIYWRQDVPERFEDGAVLRIGSSSPRRAFNIPPFLFRALPQKIGGQQPFDQTRLVMESLRGNVTTRLEKLLVPRSPSTSVLDGVVLALAGVERLFLDEEFHDQMCDLLAHFRSQLLPLKECPTAPGQGALAIECRSDDEKTRSALQEALHDQVTAEAVNRERKLLAQSGGGCHQRFGATVISLGHYGSLFSERGEVDRGADQAARSLDALSFTPCQPMAQVAPGSPLWNGSEHKMPFLETSTVGNTPQASVLLVAHQRALTPEICAFIKAQRPPPRLIAAGQKTWESLAKMGLWVDGSADGLGFEGMLDVLEGPALALGKKADWQVLTHLDAASGWQKRGIQALGTYAISKEATLDSKSLAKLAQARYVFWASGMQFQLLSKHCQKGVVHACGPGRTVRTIAEQTGNEPLVFPSSREWEQWINQKSPL